MAKIYSRSAGVVRSLLRSIHLSIALGLLTLFLVTTGFPVMAQHPQFPTAPQLTQLEQGLTLYKAGRFAAAAQLWRQAAEDYQAQGDRLNQARSLNYLSLAYQDLGQWSEAEKTILAACAIASHLAPHQNTKLILAQILNTQGSLQLGMGQAEAALNTWKQAQAAYAEAEDTIGMLGSQMNQAQALQTLGLYRRAQTTLEQVNSQLQTQPNSLLKATGLQSLGVALQVVGDLHQSQKILQQSLAITQQLNSTLDTSSILFSLGNTARDLQDYQTALELYQKAATHATTPLNQLQAQLNQLSLNLQTQQWQAAQVLLPQIQAQLPNLPPSRGAVYALVNLAESLIKLKQLQVFEFPVNQLQVESSNQSSSPQPSTFNDIAQLLARAIQQARILKDPRAESYALGQLGQLYEKNQQWAEAENLTQQALILAQGINAPEITARWQWQLGRILKQQGEGTGETELALRDRLASIAAYTTAVKTLQSLRGDLVAINPDIQFSFRESVEPIYRQLVQLLLSPPNHEEVSQENLKQARQVMESLQLAELDNFFREACLKAQPEPIDQVDAGAGVIYPIILPDRLAVILSLPGQPLRHYETRLPQSEVESLLEQWLGSLNPAFSKQERLRLSQQVYDWLIRPAQNQLSQSGVKTLVFVPDGFLGNLPMAALHDGQQYLVEKYRIALSPGSQLWEPRSLIPNQLKALTGGLSEARQGFSPLPAVELEVKQIAATMPSEVLLNQKFTSTTLEEQIQQVSFPIVHLATHGQFSSKAEDTFLLTWDGRINVKDLDRLLRAREREDANPIELLVLSACQTATGDKRAALGLAGLAVRSGARSTLATLWSVRDQSTAKLMSEFYRDLTLPKMTKAEALRQAQLTLLKTPQYEHPFYWAPFVLIGNWL